MIDVNTLQNSIVFDVETVSEYRTLDELKTNNPKKAKLWSKRCEWLRKKFEENVEMSDDELYINKAGLQPEFGKIIVITIGKMDLSKKDYSISVKSYYNDDESELLRIFNLSMTAILNKLPNLKIIGFNSKRFDIPYIAKRSYINNVKLSPVFETFGVKPWESYSIDILDIWSSGAWQEGFTSLDLMTACLDVETPKDDIDGSEVYGVYYDENDLERIKTYCEKDVVASANVLLKICGLNIVNNSNVIIGK